MQSGSVTYEQFFYWLQGYLDSKKRSTKAIREKMQNVRTPYDWLWTFNGSKQPPVHHNPYYSQPYTWCSTTVTLPSGSL